MAGLKRGENERAECDNRVHLLVPFRWFINKFQRNDSLLPTVMVWPMPQTRWRIFQYAYLIRIVFLTLIVIFNWVRDREIDFRDGLFSIFCQNSMNIVSVSGWRDWVRFANYRQSWSLWILKTRHIKNGRMWWVT